MTAFIIAMTPFVVNLLMGLFKLLTNVQDTAGKRILLGAMSIIGVVAANLLAGTPIEPSSLNGVVEQLLLAIAAFLAAHGSYTLFKASPKALPNG
jgi:type III secretory pathway component EscS